MNNNDKDSIKISAGIDKETLERLAHLFGLCLYKVNLNTRDIDLTLNTTRITGHDLDSLPNTDDTKESMIYKDDVDLVESSIASIISGEKDHYHIEYRMHRRDSSLVRIDEVGLISGYDKDGRPQYMSAIAADMSRLSWAEEKSRQMENELNRLTKGRSDNTLAEENRLLRMANAAAAVIIGGFHQDYETVLHQSIQMLGEGLQADYAGIWRNTELDGALCCYLRSHWTKGARPVGDERNTAYMKYDEFLPGWPERMAPDRFAILDGGALPKEFIDAGDIGEAESILLAPIYLHGEFWGMINFARREKIPFKDYEAETMMTGAIIIASSVSRNETFGKINMDKNKAVAETLAKGEFLSRMSHELRTPLNAIIGMTNIALREKDSEKILGHIRKVEASSQLLLTIINDVLDMSKIEAGKLEIVKEAFNFNNMLRNAENIVKVKMDEKRQRFTVIHDKSMNNLVISDEHRLLQVIVNLLNNAMKFTPEDGVISLTAIQKRISDSQVVLRVEVRDSGIGLSLDQQKKLFTAFEQADGSITRKYGGTGLGLAICKKILNLLDGDIWVKSKPNQGACFLFEIKADLGASIGFSEMAEDDIADLEETGEGAPPDLRGHTVLLAEDVEINREIVEIMLADTGVRIICVENGKEAVDLITAGIEPVELILMDVQMPVMDGLAATKLIRSMDSADAGRLPIIAMTANAFHEDIDVCLKAGMNGHIAKPFDVKMLFEILRKYLK